MLNDYKNKFILLGLGVLLLALFSCKTPPLQTPPTLHSVPEAYAAQKDSQNISNTPWGTFFAESDLNALIEEALQNNPDLLAASQKIQLANAAVLERKGALLPFVTGGVAPSIRKFGFYTMDGAGNATTDIRENQLVPVHLPDFYVGLQTTWEMDVFRKLRNQKKAALLRYLSSVEGRNLVQTNLVAEVALTYFDLLTLDNQLIVLREAIQLQEEALAVVRIQKEAGATNELAVKQFEAQVFNSKVMEAETQQSIVQSENLLNFLLGRFPQPIARTNTDVLGRVFPGVQSGIPAQLLQNRPDIRQAEFELLASNAEVLAARAAFFPTVSLTGGLGMQAFNPGLLVSPKSLAYNLVGGFFAPIFNKSAIEAAYAGAGALQREAFFNYQKTILNGFVEVNNELARIRNLDTVFALKTQEANALRQAIDISAELFRTGRANYLELLTAQQNTLAAQLELLDIRNQQWEATVNVYKALGGGWQ